MIMFAQSTTRSIPQPTQTNINEDNEDGKDNSNGEYKDKTEMTKTVNELKDLID